MKLYIDHGKVTYMLIHVCVLILALSSTENCLWYTGIIGLGHFMKARNLLYSIEDIISYARTVLFVLDGNYVDTLFRLFKAALPMERLSLDFKRALLSNLKNPSIFMATDALI